MYGRQMGEPAEQPWPHLQEAEKVAREQQKLKREYERFLGMMRHCHSTSKHWS